MFESAVTKLTLWYMGLLLIVSLTFSIPTYSIASARLRHGAEKQTQVITQGLPFDYPTTFGARLTATRDDQLQKDQRQLLLTLLLANFLVLAVGSYVSYWFAKRTLQPIQDAHEAQSRFTADASHELRTPLATMQAEIEVALRGKKLGPNEARDVLQSNLEELARLRKLSDELLALTRLDSGGLKKASVKLSAAVQDEVEHLAKRYNIPIEKQIQSGITLNGDVHLLRQVVSILVDNAVRYSGEKDPVISVHLLKREKITLTVTDKGIGIKASEIPHIFDRFYRGSSATRHSQQGHGLGLSLAKEIIAQHGGVIDVESTPGKGTTFTIIL
jgi:signal transduction histidine kinase